MPGTIVNVITTSEHGGLADWAAACRELCFPDLGALLDAADSEPAVLRVIEAAAGDVLGGIAGDTAVTQAQRESARAEGDRLAGRIEAAVQAAAAWPSITSAPNNLLDARHLLSESGIPAARRSARRPASTWIATRTCRSSPRS